MTSRATVTGDDFEISVGIFETVNGDLDAVVVLLNELRNAVL